VRNTLDFVTPVLDLGIRLWAGMVFFNAGMNRVGETHDIARAAVWLA
jgi:hypothetical protein